MKRKAIFIIFLSVLFFGFGWGVDNWGSKQWKTNKWNGKQWDSGDVTPVVGVSVLKESGVNATKEDGTDWLKE
jgi:hypothetical protein